MGEALSKMDCQWGYRASEVSYEEQRDFSKSQKYFLFFQQNASATNKRLK